MTDRSALTTRHEEALARAARIVDQTAALRTVEIDRLHEMIRLRTEVKEGLRAHRFARRRRVRVDRRTSRRTDSDADLMALHRSYRDTRDPEIRRALVERYVGLARSMALRVARGADVDDAVQVAMYGLLQALERFDPSLGFAFSTFAHATIDGELKRFRRKTSWTVHVPRRMQERYLEVRSAVDELTNEFGRVPSIEEIGRLTDLSGEQVIEALEFRSAVRPASLDSSAGETASGGHDVAQVDTGFEQVERRDLALQLLDRLSDREREIVEMRFVQNLRQKDIAERVGLSQMHVSRVLRQALDRLRALAEERA